MIKFSGKVPHSIPTMKRVSASHFLRSIGAGHRKTINHTERHRLWGWQEKKGGRGDNRADIEWISSAIYWEDGWRWRLTKSGVSHNKSQKKRNEIYFASQRQFFILHLTTIYYVHMVFVWLCITINSECGRFERQMIVISNEMKERCQICSFCFIWNDGMIISIFDFYDYDDIRRFFTSVPIKLKWLQ